MDVIDLLYKGAEEYIKELVDYNKMSILYNFILRYIELNYSEKVANIGEKELDYIIMKVAFGIEGELIIDDIIKGINKYVSLLK